MDITDYDQVEYTVSRYKPTHVVHLAAMISECDRYPKDAYRTNVDATVNLWKTALKYGAKRMVFLSTAAVYHQTKLSATTETENVNPKSIYGMTKWKAEQELEKLGGVVILRPFNIYGSRFPSSLIQRMIGNESIDLVNPDNFWRDYVHISDVITAIERSLSLDIKPCTINVCSGFARSTRVLLRELESRGYRPDVREVNGDESISWGDPSRLHEVLGFMPSCKIIID